MLLVWLSLIGFESNYVIKYIIKNELSICFENILITEDPKKGLSPLLIYANLFYSILSSNPDYRPYYDVAI